MNSKMLEIHDIKKDYGKSTALAGVSFAVEQGEMFGLLGPNGAGKTTLLSIISCLMQPTSGNVMLQGARLNRTDQSIRRVIGIVPQELALYDDLTARENLHFAGRLYSISGADLKNRANEILDLIGLADRANRRASTFSGGMKRRLNLGIALMHKPKLLLLDEPTTGVDPQSRNHIFEGVRRLNSEGVTIIYTSHYMEEVQSLCSRVGIIDHGKLIACDTLNQLLHRMDGIVRFRVPNITGELRSRLQQWKTVRYAEGDDPNIELECQDVKTALMDLVSILNELRIELTNLETEEPNLERVFLHLTGRALRD